MECLYSEIYMVQYNILCSCVIFTHTHAQHETSTNTHKPSTTTTWRTYYNALRFCTNTAVVYSSGRCSFSRIRRNTIKSIPSALLLCSSLFFFFPIFFFPCTFPIIYVHNIIQVINSGRRRPCRLFIEGKNRVYPFSFTAQCTRRRLCPTLLL